MNTLIFIGWVILIISWSIPSAERLSTRDHAMFESWAKSTRRTLILRIALTLLALLSFMLAIFYPNV